MTTFILVAVAAGVAFRRPVSRAVDSFVQEVFAPIERCEHARR